MAEIRLSGVNKVYPGGTHAVHDVDLHIADGEFMIMVGPSGCAKSTILRMIAGLETPTSGTVEIGGRVVNDVAPKDRDIAMVFQSYALYPHMTVRENMAFGLRLRKMPQGEIDQRVADAARILGLEALLDRLPKAMSGGQRQRVAMGRAIVREPQAFLMDEPLSNLDAKLRVQMRTEIAKLHQRLETTTVYVTHDQVEAMTLGQRICILRKGVVQQVDTPFQVYQNPANVFVGGFMGSPGMNFLNGHLVLHDGVLHLQLGDQHLPVPASVSSRLVATTDLHGRGVIVGIRPEHLAMSTPGDANAIPVNVELTEAMGAEVYAYFTANVGTPDLSALSDTQASSATFVARLGAGTDTRGGERIMLRPDLEEAHLFDAQSLLTLLAPANEADVRQRQSGAAIQLATGTANAAPTAVAAPQSMIVQSVQPIAPMQPVIHLHQTIVQPEQPTYGTLADPASPAAIASVFDQPIASPIHVEPLVVGAATRVDVAASGGTANPHAPIAPPTVPAPFASRAASGTERPAFAARPTAAYAQPTSQPTTGPYASLAGSGDRAMDHHVTTGAPGPAGDEPLGVEPAMVEPTMVEPAVVEPAVVEPAPAPAPVRRGFAPRIIGAAPEPVAPAPATSAEATGYVEPVTTVTIDADDLDAAVDALDAAGAASADETATIGSDDLAIGDPVTMPLARVPAHEPGGTSAFRDALARVRGQQQSGSAVAPRFGAVSPVGVIPPPLSLSPDAPIADADAPATPPGPMVVQPPTISGITPRPPAPDSA